jgi:hypothetical protein
VQYLLTADEGQERFAAVRERERERAAEYHRLYDRADRLADITLTRDTLRFLAHRGDNDPYGSFMEESAVEVEALVRGINLYYREGEGGGEIQTHPEFYMADGRQLSLSYEEYRGADGRDYYAEGLYLPAAVCEKKQQRRIVVYFYLSVEARRILFVSPGGGGGA